MSQERPRAIFYIDGFNLYNGLKRRAEAQGRAASEHKWLNLGKLATFLAPEADIVRVRYFTSRVRRRLDNPNATIRQATFLRALQTIPNLTIHEGFFQRNRVWRRLVDDHETSVRVVDFKEKGSDVNLATYLIHDALTKECELAYVISSDSDLSEPIRLARAALPHGVMVLSPNTGRLRKLASVATAVSQIHDRAFAACHFPAELKDTDGLITKPTEW